MRKYTITKPQSVELLSFLVFYFTISTRHFTSVQANKSNGSTTVMASTAVLGSMFLSNKEVERKCMKKEDRKCNREENGKKLLHQTYHM